MNTKEFFPGRKVSIDYGGEPLYGVIGHAYSGKGQEVFVKFSNGMMVYVTERNHKVFALDPLN